MMYLQVGMKPRHNSMEYWLMTSFGWRAVLFGTALLGMATALPAFDGGADDWEDQWGATAGGAEADPREPLPALMVPDASRHMIMDIAHAGSRLVAVGDYGNIVVSDDGQEWRQVPSPVDVMLVRLYFSDALRGWAVGYDGVVLHTEDGGEQWRIQRWSPGDRTLYDVIFLDQRRGIAVGGYGTYLSTDDGGETWVEEDLDISLPGLHFNAITQLGDGSLFLSGERGLLALSHDDGMHWQVVDSPYMGSIFGAVPMGERGVVIHGLRGNVYVADDIGAVVTMESEDWDEYERETITDPEAVAELGWRQLENPGSDSLFGGTSLPDGALLVGVNGVVQRVTLGSDEVRTLPTGEGGTLVNLIEHEGAWIAVGRRGVRRLTDLVIPMEGTP
jgi:photosystem II stability/assembly factor-like uncharacterized protein